VPHACERRGELFSWIEENPGGIKGLESISRLIKQGKSDQYMDDCPGAGRRALQPTNQNHRGTNTNWLCPHCWELEPDSEPLNGPE